MTALETPRLKLLPYTPGDLDHLAALYADGDVTANTKLGQLNREQAKQTLDEYLATWRTSGFGMYAALDRATGEYVGEAGLFERDGGDDPALRYIVHKRFWGQGLAYEAAHAVIGYAFQNLSLNRLDAFVEGTNEASHRIAQKLGFAEQERLQISKGILYRYGMGAATWNGQR
jgi:[ribosomal protein S5]-alanine N-acetyltransferase